MPGTTLIGREHELVEVVARVDEGRRLITIVGPGGIGKTSLALGVGDALATRFPLGTHVVDLTLIADAEAVRGAIAGQLGFPSFDALLGSPEDQDALLVIDNCEHVAAAAADAVAALLVACPSPTVIATSRSPLGAPGESIVTLGPLELPASGTSDPRAASVRLFIDRARHAGAGDPGADLDVVAELCRRLDGLPLAIELAAARLRTLTPAEILDRLDHGVDVLARPRFRGITRHRSLRDTIEWSYRLLDDDARRTFHRVAVCAGPFSADTAASLAGVGTDGGDALDLIEQLLDASLLSTDRSGSVMRYRMLGTIRSFALERLAASGDEADARDRFAAHVIEHVLGIMRAGRGGWDAATLSELLGLYDNIVAALRWCIQHDDVPDRPLLLYSVLWGVVHQAHLDDIVELGWATFAKWEDPRLPLAADAAATLSTGLYLIGRIDEATQLAERALEGADASFFAPATLRRVLGMTTRAVGDTDRSIAEFERGARAAKERELDGFAMELDVFGAQTRAFSGLDADVDAALAVVRDVHARAMAGGWAISAAWARTVEGSVLVRRDPAAATPVIEAALELARASDYPFGVHANLRSLALADIAAGRFDEAANTVLELADRAGRTNALWDVGLLVAPAAVLFRRLELDGWRDLVATVRALPPVNPMIDTGCEVADFDATGGIPLSPRDAVALVRRELGRALDGAPSRSTQPSAGGPRSGSADTSSVGVFVRRGDMWELTFDGVTVHLAPSKGLDDLARLLASPGREIHCLELAGAAVEERDIGTAIDARARRESAERVRELQAEIDEADANNDRARAERARVELDQIVDELTAALGLGGRARRSGGTAERARSAVTHRIRAAIKRIDEAHPTLGRHLGVSVTSGAYCCYRPDREVTWTV